MRSKMDLVSGYKGVVGLMFGNENSSSSEDSYVERLLERINNGTKAEDRRMAMTELQSVVAESHAAQLAFGAMGFPVLMCVLKEDRDDVEMIQGALETILGALTPLNYKAPKDGVQPATLNADLLSREADNISLLLSLLSEEDFYVRYYTLQLLTALLTNAPSRLQEVILATPQGITRLMDMLMDREVIRNEALLLLTYLTREAEEIQKIVVFENAYEKIFSIIREEGGSDGGVVVQDCLELLNNILRNNASNQTLLRETMGFDPVVHLLRLRDYSFTQQKTINLLGAIETINLLIAVGSESDPSKHSNCSKNKTVLVQKGVLDNLLTLGVESHWAPASMHSAALRCIGDLIAMHSNNMNVLASKVLGEGPEHEPALNSILKTVMRPSNIEEFVAADYVFKCFCENNPDGQSMLASTLIPQPHLLSNDSLADDISLSFGSLLLRGLTVNETDGDLEICSRSASVLSHILKGNAQCKEKALKIELEAPTQSLGGSEPLLHRMVKYLALASSTNSNAEKSKSHGKKHLYIPQIILKLLITWLMDCPQAVNCFLDARPHLTYLIELVGNTSSTAGSRGLAAILLGECVIYNDSAENGKDAFALADAISQKLGLTSYFLRFDELWRSTLLARTKQPEQRRPLTARSSTGNLSESEDIQEVTGGDGQGSEDHPILASLFDDRFVSLVRKLEGVMRERIVEVYSRPKNSVAVVPAELEQHGGESDREYIQRLKSFVQKQCYEIQDVLRRNASLAEDVAKAGKIPSEQRPASSGGGGSDRVHFETIGRELQEANQRVEMLRAEKAKLESEASMFKNMASKTESDLKSLSDAYNSLEQTNYALENVVKAMRAGGDATYPDIEKIKEEAREEAQKESEGELNDLLVCLGQEQSKVEKLTSRLEELGEDVDKLLEDIGDESALPEDGNDEDDDLNDDDKK